MTVFEARLLMRDGTFLRWKLFSSREKAFTWANRCTRECMSLLGIVRIDIYEVEVE